MKSKSFLRLQLAATLGSLLLLGNSPVNASDIKISTKIDTNQILIGDHVRFTIEIFRNNETQLFWPDLGNVIKIDSLREIEVLSSFHDTLEQSGFLKEVKTYTFTVFDSGYYVIPPFTVKYKRANDSNQVLLTEATLLIVKSIEIDTSAGIKPIKDPMTMPFQLSEILKEIIIGAVILGLIAGIILFLSLRKRKPPVVKKFVRKDPPHEIALKKLMELDEKKLWQQGEVKLYYSELSEILREYIENRFNIPALESTTDEIMDRIDITSISGKTKEDLRMALLNSDLVKFAKANPLPDEHKKYMEFCFGFVKTTKSDEQAQNVLVEEKT